MSLRDLHGSVGLRLNRIGWHRIGLALSLCIVGIAVAVLCRVLQGVDSEGVLKALRTTDESRLVLAACAVAIAYVTLTLYDLFALRIIRRSIPYRVVARAGFTSNSIGHATGLASLVGGAIRYRIYSSYGLDAIDVAKLCFLVALTFWLGNAAALGIGIVLAPQAATSIDHLPPSVNRAVAWLVLFGLAGYLIWVWRSSPTIGRGGWRMRLPNGSSTLMQIGLGMVDLLFCSLAMYALLPAHAAIQFLPFAVVFVSAMVLGFASHTPGGLGVFDATMLIALDQIDREGLLASLLLFRLIYYVAPLVIALFMLGTREIGRVINSSLRRSMVSR